MGESNSFSQLHWQSMLKPLTTIGRLKLERPLVAFDLETTGLSRETGRIVEFAAVKVFPNGRCRCFRYLINPGTPIPPHATKVHKIRNEDVVQKPFFCGYAESILEIFKDSDMLGFNNIAFDRPYLAAEFKRWRPDLQFPAEGTREVDAMKIYHAKEKKARNSSTSQISGNESSSCITTESRLEDLEDTADSASPANVVKKAPKMNLTSALKFYLGLDLENAHSALADADATLRVLLAQVDLYEDLPNNVPGLHQFCQAKAQQNRRSSTSTRTPSARHVPQTFEVDSLARALEAWDINQASSSKPSQSTSTANATTVQSRREMPQKKPLSESPAVQRSSTGLQMTQLDLPFDQGSLLQQLEKQRSKQNNKSSGQQGDKSNEQATGKSSAKAKPSARLADANHAKDPRRPQESAAQQAPNLRKGKQAAATSGTAVWEAPKRESQAVQSCHPDGSAHQLSESGHIEDSSKYIRSSYVLQNTGWDASIQPQSYNQLPHNSDVYRTGQQDYHGQPSTHNRWKSSHDYFQGANSQPDHAAEPCSGYPDEHENITYEDYANSYGAESQPHNDQIQRNVVDLSSIGAQSQSQAEQSDGRLYFKYEGTEIYFAFGKYSGCSVYDIASNDPGYLQWMQNARFPRHVDDVVQHVLGQTH